MTENQPAVQRWVGKPIPLALGLIFMIVVYFGTLGYCLNRYARSGSTSVGVNSEIFLFETGSTRDRIAATILRPWAKILERRIYWSTLTFPQKIGEKLQETHFEEK